MTKHKVRKPFSKWSKEFLDELRQHANVTKAARGVGVSRKTAYKRRNKNVFFREAWDDARDEAIDMIEGEAFRRAVEGVEKPVGWYKGESHAVIREYSDVLLLALLKANRPEKYRERQDIKHSGETTVNVKGYVEVSPDDWDD